MKLWLLRHAAVIGGMSFLGACSGSGSSATPPPSQATVQLRFAEGAPALEAIIDGVPQDIGAAFLQVDGQTVSSSFDYGSFTQFASFGVGTHSLSALDDLGYRVGPLKIPPLTAGKQYTLVLVGSYPNYQVLRFEEPAVTGGAQEALYEASPSQTQADFGRFTASSHSHFVKLGNAAFGEIATVALGSHVGNFGGYAGEGTKPFKNGTFAPSQIDSFDKTNALPFHNVSRLSLFVFDAQQSSTPVSVFASLDR
ncbi:MAG TPA: hypothetical protein VGX91_00495 [Candidatus Cybelea sp.]|jgi:hypothetical protein|nr:hypothetical protein [Candidatus Cybelea sp.]